jgi:antitoxin StbD
MINNILSDFAVSISDLKRNPMEAVRQGEGAPIAILNHNKPAFYCVPAETYEKIMDRLENIELNILADSRSDQKRVRVSLDEI